MGDEKERFIRINCKSGFESLVQVGVHQGSVILLLLFAITVDNITESARDELMNEILYADDLISISESIKNSKEKFFKLKKTFESKGLKMNLKKTKVMVNG